MVAHYFESPLGRLAIVGDDRAIYYLIGPGQALPENAKAGSTPLLVKGATQIAEYFAGEREMFDLPTQPQGTPFQRACWEKLTEIPYGETRSYKDIAEAIGNAKSVRAVGMANNRNPIPIIIPCHRVIGADGSLMGFGWGLDAKEKLLVLEGSRL